MPRIVGATSNEKFDIGCTGGTVFVYDKNGNELARFKGLRYAYLPVISPKGDIFVVKSTEGILAVYSLVTLTLIKKFRTSKVNYAQDDGCCFSADGSYFLNIERQIDDLHNAISVYDTSDFFRVSQWMLGEDISVSFIEEYQSEYYVLGQSSIKKYEYFVGKYKAESITDLVKVSADEWWNCIEKRIDRTPADECRSLAEMWRSHYKKITK